MIDGFRLTFTGEELRTLLDARAAEHRANAGHWERERARTAEDQTEDAPLLPDHLCENEAERQVWRAEVLEFLRDHLEPLEVYRLGEVDLAFAELLPPAPGWLEQEEYEERTRVGFELSRIGKRICEAPEIIHIGNRDAAALGPG